MAAGAPQAMTTGVMAFVGGPDMEVPAGRSVRAVEFIAGAASTALTNCWAALMIPDDGNPGLMTVVATSQDFLTATWAIGARIFGFAGVDGGSGIWTPQVDTPVYAGLVQVGTGLATVRGLAGQTGNATHVPKWWGTASGTFSNPGSLPGVVTQNNGNACICTCRLMDALT